MRTFLIRRYSFRASHWYGDPDRSREENRSRFGEQADPHSHDWRLEVVVGGEPDPETGFLVELDELDRVVQEKVLGTLARGDINHTVPEVASGEIHPSTEGLAGWIWHRLTGALPAGVYLARVRIFESGDLGAEVELVEGRGHDR